MRSFGLGHQGVKRILVTGNGKSGSYKIRAEQLGAAIGADVIPHAIPRTRYDLGIIVKRVDPRTLAAMHAQRIPIVLDIVDGWPQPGGNLWARDDCMAWLRTNLKTLKPHAVVAATRAMKDDVEELGFRGQVLALPHHARPGMAANPIRERVEIVGYEGGVQYLGKWLPIVEAECKARGWRLVLNPPELSDLDIVLALREADGYAPRQWKSGVKLANAQGSGTPFIGCPEAGYRETDNGAALWATNRRDLSRSFDELTGWTMRTLVAEQLRAAEPKLAGVAQTYREWLESL